MLVLRSRRPPNDFKEAIREEARPEDRSAAARPRPGQIRRLAPGTVNLRVKGVKKLGVRLVNWLTPEQGEALWQTPDAAKLKGKGLA